MLQDEKFANDVKQLIELKQKKSAFIYVRNHLGLIEQALHEGAKIADIYELLQKNGISITLPTLRLYLHRLRNANRKIKTKILNSVPAKIEEKSQENINNYTHEYNQSIQNLQDVQLIKNQTPNLEELSKAFQRKNS